MWNVFLNESPGSFEEFPNIPFQASAGNKVTIPVVRLCDCNPCGDVNYSLSIEGSAVYGRDYVMESSSFSIPSR